ncbi:hypothetical protein GCM10010510_48030 [Streptomyces anandii JCM 4720]|nr:hypothetical protein GCM10010510_48030 [Streptomyces anandii JCM 4720]
MPKEKKPSGRGLAYGRTTTVAVSLPDRSPVLSAPAEGVPDMGAAYPWAGAGNGG